ncbi:hypothetical protein KI387_034483, partial [Taxus chinensis]
MSTSSPKAIGTIGPEGPEPGRIGRNEHKESKSKWDIWDKWTRTGRISRNEHKRSQKKMGHLGQKDAGGRRRSLKANRIMTRVTRERVQSQRA